MNKFTPLLIGILALIIVLLIPMKTKLFEVLVILFAIPFVTYQKREKDAGDHPYQGGLQGGVIGGFTGVVLNIIVSSYILHDIAKHSIRLDFLLAGVLGASIGSTLGIIAGERHSKRQKETK